MTTETSVAMFPYEEEYNFTLTIVKEATRLFSPAYNSDKNVETKESSSDLVTGGLLFGINV